MYAKSLLTLLLVTSVFAEDTDALLEGFDDTEQNSQQIDATDVLLEGFDEVDTPTVSVAKQSAKNYNIEGKLTESAAYSFHNDAPHDDLSMLKSTLFLEYNHNFTNNFKLKINANTFYDLSFAIQGRDNFTEEDKSALEREIELFDFYVQGALTDQLDIKVGRQVVVWGKSDSIRITDVLNPLDNRRPAMVDIEDMRLPEGMVKFDYYHKNWRFSPILIVEQRFNKNPPFGGDFNPTLVKPSTQETPNSPSYALNIAGEFSGFDIDFYLASIYAQDELGLPQISHDHKIDMLGTAFNYVYESWLFKGEFAYKKAFQFLQSGAQTYNRLDSLVGVEYKGIAETTLSYDIANKHMTENHPQFAQNTYQHAFHATSDFFNATLHANYLISLFGKKLDQGGFQRAWFKYDIADGLSTNIGIVDYIGGNRLFDAIDDNDMIFADISYSF